MIFKFTVSLETCKMSISSTFLNILEKLFLMFSYLFQKFYHSYILFQIAFAFCLFFLVKHTSGLSALLSPHWMSTFQGLASIPLFLSPNILLGRLFHFVTYSSSSRCYKCEAFSLLYSISLYHYTTKFFSVINWYLGCFQALDTMKRAALNTSYVSFSVHTCMHFQKVYSWEVKLLRRSLDMFRFNA